MRLRRLLLRFFGRGRGVPAPSAAAEHTPASEWGRIITAFYGSEPIGEERLQLLRTGTWAQVLYFGIAEADLEEARTLRPIVLAAISADKTSRNLALEAIDRRMAGEDDSEVLAELLRYGIRLERAAWGIYVDDVAGPDDDEPPVT
jgi:hypothetical protein